MKILYTAAECMPFIKTGGLADVGYGLTKSLVKKGHEVVVMLPKFQNVIEDYGKKLEHITDFYVSTNSGDKYCGLDKIKLEGVTFIFIDNEEYFNRDTSSGYYNNGDETIRFSFFSRAILDSLSYINFFPDVLHTNDWHTGLVGHILNTEHRHDERYRDIKLFLTIHNLKFQGWHNLNDLGSLNIKYNDNIVMGDCVNFLKAGIMNAYKINTVSPSYRNATLTPIAGCGLDSVLRIRENDYLGILNGIDNEFFTPKNNKFIYKAYTEKTYIENKPVNKEKFKEEFGLSGYQRPLYSLISRIDSQKGIDVLINDLDDILCENLDLFILGAGDQYLIDRLEEYNHKYDNLSIYIGFSEEIAHKAYAASDYFLMPSKFEPCGLSQMISLAFATIPIVTNVDGLADSIVEYNDFTNEGYGLKIHHLTNDNLLDQVKRAQYLYYNFNHIDFMRKNAIDVDFSFDTQVNQYIDMYKS